jgi:hypothetical protein
MKMARSHERTTNPTDGHKKVEMILTDGTDSLTVAAQ